MNFNYDKKRDSFSNKLSLLGKSTNIDYIHKLIETGRIKSGNKESTKIIFSTIIDVLDRFHNLNYDIKYYQEDYSFGKILVIPQILIRYPNITITNSNSNTHVIKDFFVCFDIITHNGFKLNIPTGFKTTYSYEEYVNSYEHSHLQKNNLAYNNLVNSSFCFGNPSDLLMSLKSFNDLIQYRDSLIDIESLKMNFERLLFNVDTFVKWESLEGKPYISIDSFKETTSNIDYNVQHDSNYYNFTTKGPNPVKKETINRFLSSDIDYKLYWSSNKIKIRLNQKFIQDFSNLCYNEFKKQILAKLIDKHYLKYNFVKVIGNKAYPYNNEEKSFKDRFYVNGRTPSFVFRKELVQFTIKDYNKNIANNIKVLLKPEILEFYIAEIELIINNIINNKYNGKQSEVTCA